MTERTDNARTTTERTDATRTTAARPDPTEIPPWLRVLILHPTLLAAAVVLAVVAALGSGFTLRDGAIVSTAPVEYRAATTLLLGGGERSPYRAGADPAERESGVTSAQAQDLSNVAAVYAYLVSGAEIRTAVTSVEGPLGADEAVGAVRRTTQPSGDEKNSGRFTLPLLSVLGSSTDPDRAVLLSRAAASAFLAHVTAEQDAEAIPADVRVTLTVTDEGGAVAGSAGNTVLPMAAVGLGVLALALAAIYAIHGVGLRRRRAAEG
ncbi:hypothetical protein HQQ80_13170 [Microbacteriaceae bacterium VKM Ac-2855]|nr:hypothetical protein [Microbacteriaceae bacterium VKM Ac-2855]